MVFSFGLHTAIELGYLNEQKEIYDNLKNIFIAKNDYKQAYQYISKSNKIKDSISQLQKDKEVNEIEVKYKTLQKENEIILLKKDQEIQEAKLVQEKSNKNIILYSFLILLVPIIGLQYIYYQKLQAQSELNKKQEEINKKEIAALLTDQELKIIKAAVKGKDKERKRIAQELHDSIGGNLAAIKLKLNNSVNDYQANSINTINLQLDETYEQVRHLSHDLISKKISKNNFCNIVKEYIQSIWGDNSEFNAYPKEKINLLNEDLQNEIFKIFQELTTNTIKHAKATSIELQINLIENELNILFEDNGIGFNPEHQKEGIGYENIKNRLNKFRGSLNIDSRINRGTIINIEIPTLTAVHNEV
ncbi:hypothetical protein F6U93_00165 [Tamlana haliotis]|uniref:histidine kinase n=1 Tax=Pseudotamlana haliotis TaxID=2614804 RepID=A0A6N6MKW3_9FLAO|nr:ATP-binding protein [Tamlana haliotis]KAB1071893.1 hypothetical protein F6U93_00165 [Tamlana haliotis]